MSSPTPPAWPSPEENSAAQCHEPHRLSEPLSEEEARSAFTRRTRRSFLAGGAAVVAGAAGWRWWQGDRRAAWLERAFRWNETLSRAFFRPQRLAPEFNPTVAQERTNGDIGLESPLEPAAWRLQIGGLAGRTEDLVLSLEDLRALPRTEMTVELKCIEGWSVIVHWAGVRFSDFAAHYAPATLDGSVPDVTARPESLLPYVSLATPDREYYVGWDTASILHPQTLLAYEMNGAPLTVDHGAPLRLATATKYGIKQIKRIGRIHFTSERPADYWAERGYDWYAGH